MFDLQFVVMLDVWNEQMTVFGYFDQFFLYLVIEIWHRVACILHPVSSITATLSATISCA